MLSPSEIPMQQPSVSEFSAMQSHLTDEQFAELLLGSTAAAVHAHLSICPECADEAERVSGAIGSFEQQTRLWAELRAATHPVLTSARQPALGWLQLPAGPQAWAAAAVAIALAFGIGVTTRNRRNTEVAESSSPSISVQTAVQAPAAQAAAPAAGTENADRVEATGARAEAAPRVSPMRLKADNDLLSAIDGELRADDSTPASSYGLLVSAHGVRARATNGAMNE